MFLGKGRGEVISMKDEGRRMKGLREASRMDIENKVAFVISNVERNLFSFKVYRPLLPSR